MFLARTEQGLNYDLGSKPGQNLKTSRFSLLQNEKKKKFKQVLSQNEVRFELCCD